MKIKTIKSFEKASILLDRSRYIAPEVYADGKRTSVEKIVAAIVNEVAGKGDTALLKYTEKFDGVRLKRLRVSPREILDAYKQIDQTLISDLKVAAARIRKFHIECKDTVCFSFEKDNLGRVIRPLNMVGIYVPGGKAAYPSTVLMTAVPAKVAGVLKIIMVTPPQPDGNIPAATLVAADIAGVDEIFKVGGAQGIAALAYGTATIPKVDKICGPGNIFVSTAKRQVYGAVDIDGIQGPSEIIVVADKTSNPAYCAADLIAQSEHDELATSILITDSHYLAENTFKQINRLMVTLSRKDTIGKALQSGGLIVIIENMEQAIKLVNLFAPEHLMLMMQNAKKYLPRIKNAGCIFIGKTSPVVLGDYIAGPSHVLPTGGTSRYSSPLGIESFLKITNYAMLNKQEQNRLGQIVIRLANQEGLDAHANAINIRLKK